MFLILIFLSYFHLYNNILAPGTHISNTREAKAFALLQEEGIAKGVRRITAVTTECAFKAMELASSFYTEFEDVVKSEGSTQEKVYSTICYKYY